MVVMRKRERTGMERKGKKKEGEGGNEAGHRLYIYIIGSDVEISLGYYGNQEMRESNWILARTSQNHKAWATDALGNVQSAVAA